MLVAIDRDHKSARVAVARRPGGSRIVDEVFTIDLKSAETSTEVWSTIFAELNSRGLGRAELLVAAGRAAVEMRRLSVPPAPDDELAEMVRFQALRQLPAMTEDWTVDYLPMSSFADGGARDVLAAAISPENLKQFRSTCETNKVQPKRLLLRSCAAATVARQEKNEACLLVVNVLDGEADVTLVDAAVPAIVRTIRIPEQGLDASTLAGEIRRTLAAATNQLPDKHVQRIVLLGSEAEHLALTTELRNSLDDTVDCVNPFSAVHARISDADQTDRPGRFAPVIGMLAAEARGEQHSIDFMSPRKRIEPPSKNRQHVLTGLAISSLVAAIAGFVWLQLRDLDHKIANLKTEMRDLQENEEIVTKQLDQADDLDKWVQGDFTWLDELHRLATRFPDASDVRLSGIEMRSAPDGGRVVLQGFMDNHAVISQLRQQLGDEDRRTVTVPGGREGGDDPDYAWRFNANIDIAPLSIEQLEDRMNGITGAASTEPSETEDAASADDSVRSASDSQITGDES